MANITSTLAVTSGFVPDYWAAQALDVLRANLVLQRLVAKDTDFGEVGWKGKTINVPYPGTFTAQDKVTNTPLTPQVPTGGATVALTLDRHKTVPFLVEDFAAALANQSLFERYIKPATIALAEQVETDLFNLYTGFTPGNTLGTDGVDLSRATIINARTKLNQTKAPMSERYLVVSAKDEGALLADSTLQTYFAFAKPEAITNGAIARMFGFDVHMSQLTPLSGTHNPQVITLTSATGGTFTITAKAASVTPDVTTAAIAYNAAAAAVQAALLTAGVSAIVTGSAGGPYTIDAEGAYAAGDTAWTVTDSTTGSGHAIAVTDAGTIGNRCIAFHKNALIMAMRKFDDSMAGQSVFVGQIADDVSGLVIRLSAQYSINDVGWRFNVDVLYGCKVLRPTQGVTILT